MKSIILLLATTAFASCAYHKEIQVEMVRAELIHIDTVYRYPSDDSRKQLTWRDHENVEYVSYAPLQSSSYPVGTRLIVMRRK